MLERRHLTISRSGNRSLLFMGCDREMIMMLGVLVGALIFSAQDLIASFVGVLFWFLGLILFRKMAKSDPFMRHVYIKQLQYRKFYPARTRYDSSKPSIKL